MSFDREQWLRLTREEVVEPELPICDPHHHLWERGGFIPYLLPELTADTTSGHHVVCTVFVECDYAYRQGGRPEMEPVGETEFVAGVADASAVQGGPEIRGIVGHADLRLGPLLDEVLDAHEAAGGGRFRGMRDRVSHDPTGDPRTTGLAVDPPPGLLHDPDFRAGVATLGRRGLTFDAWLYHPQLHDLAALARQVPETTIVLNHLGGPLGVGAYAEDPEATGALWRAGMEAVAACPNVVVKIGGIGMPMYGDGWHRMERPPTSDQVVEAWGDRIDFVIDAFGPDRCMCESNFPVDRLSFGYVVVWNAFKKISASYTTAEQAALLHDTAVRVYRL